MTSVLVPETVVKATFPGSLGSSGGLPESGSCESDSERCTEPFWGPPLDWGSDDSLVGDELGGFGELVFWGSPFKLGEGEPGAGELGAGELGAGELGVGKFGDGSREGEFGGGRFEEGVLGEGKLGEGMLGEGKLGEVLGFGPLVLPFPGLRRGAAILSPFPPFPSTLSIPRSGVGVGAEAGGEESCWGGGEGVGSGFGPPTRGVTSGLTRGMEGSETGRSRRPRRSKLLGPSMIKSKLGFGECFARPDETGS